MELSFQAILTNKSLLLSNNRAFLFYFLFFFVSQISLAPAKQKLKSNPKHSLSLRVGAAGGRHEPLWINNTVMLYATWLTIKNKKTLIIKYFYSLPFTLRCTKFIPLQMPHFTIQPPVNWMVSGQVGRVVLLWMWAAVWDGVRDAVLMLDNGFCRDSFHSQGLMTFLSPFSLTNNLKTQGSFVAKRKKRIPAAFERWALSLNFCI